MESRQKKRLGDMLIEEQIITDEQLSDALEKKRGLQSGWVRFW